MVFYVIARIILPDQVSDDLIKFIRERYQKPLPNSLLIAQAFILDYPEYGKVFGLSALNYIIEDSVKQGLFGVFLIFSGLVPFFKEIPKIQLNFAYLIFLPSTKA